MIWTVIHLLLVNGMASARMNNFSFWILLVATTLLLSSFLVLGGAPSGGWTIYAPLTAHMGPGMTLMKMPMFCWTRLITPYLLIAVMPVLAGAITMVLTHRHFGTLFFSVVGGGDPIMFQHIFWFLGHPEVYIMILPAFGIMSGIVPAFSRKTLFGYSSIVYATASIAILSFIVWAHHMFATGMPVTGQLFFMYATMLIAVPTGVKLFNWVATMWKGSMTFETPNHRFHLRVHHGRLYWFDSSDGANRYWCAGYLLCCCSLPLCIGSGLIICNVCRLLLLVF